MCAFEIFVDPFLIGGGGFENKLICGQLGKGMKNVVGQKANSKGFMFFSRIVCLSERQHKKKIQKKFFYVI
jgi:hypothetical protein